MKTLILFSSSEIGGAEQSLSRLSNAGKKGEYLLGSLSGDGILLNQEKNIKKIVHKFGYKKKSYFNLVISCFKAIKFSQKNKINNLYVCGFKACSIIRILSLFFKTPKIFHAIRWNPISNNFDDRIFRGFERIFIFKTCGWICNSLSAKETLINFCGIPKNKTFSIHNGIELSKLKNIVRKKNHILTLSNFAPRKGIIEYLDVIEKVIKEKNNIKFIIAGRDDMKGIVQAEIKKRNLEEFVFTPGFILNTDTLFQNSKIMVLPSLLPEGCPTSILEGMSWGLPIVCYNIKGLNELVLNNKTGYIVPLNNKQEMSQMIIKLLNNPTINKEFGINGKNHIKQNFTMTEMLKQHRTVFNISN